MSNATTVSIPAAELAQGGTVTHTVAGREVMVCRNKDDGYAVDNSCTHAYATPAI